MYKFGSQPPLLLAFYRDYEPMSELWNFRHLGMWARHGVLCIYVWAAVAMMTGNTSFSNPICTAAVDMS